MDVASLFNVKVKPHSPTIPSVTTGVGYMISEGYVANGATNDDIEIVDLQKLDDCRRLVDELAARTAGRLHVLVNNSGATWGEPFDTYPDAAWTKLLTLNLQRVFTLTQLATPLLEAAAAAASSSSSSATEGGGGGGGGRESFADPSRVINIGSVDGLRVPLMSSYAYSASKAGLHHLSRALARELGPRGITSNALACGPFESKMMRATLDSMRDVIESEVPLRRIGTPQDVAGACLFLSGRAGAFVTGATITVDGGMVLASKL
ncbi:short chain dehydrogenase/reductase family protein [Colletotrichum graminicola M1.001]|uniref:Short chain dehydrogenase/reductase family protein n=1 Tax=Colletotrichum graminicola (strain M1.001 / M2 / FGSC 10212) TaxID=645133 RepID=E3QEA6_COLGM|nr:short chain dehydrogenase/reductase family protein [Colletotrichum graminicola M1.001]EFQ29194.1 short chain dehydrogenase/reductase family protein [Colletotrichum graminicola M1.001]